MILGIFCFYGEKMFFKKLKYIFKLIFFIFLDYFDNAKKHEGISIISIMSVFTMDYFCCALLPRSSGIIL
jgi:hypothetical protein